MLHIYVISLERDTEKRKVIKETLQGFNLNFSFINAIDGTTLPESQINFIRERSVGAVASRGFPATAGEIGCTLSHVKAYHQVLEDNQIWACILEDDVILDERFKVFINTFQSTNMNSKDLYLMGGQCCLWIKYIIKSNRNINYIGGAAFHKTIRSQYLVQRTCCYLISSAMAKKLLRLSQERFIVADDWGYLSENKYINRIYLADFVEHPTDLSASNLQKGREEATLTNPSKKNGYMNKLQNTLKRHIRYQILTAYKYIERKDRV
ncbi:glycosyltransferase family 25 protein [Psychrobacter immobilis]|uniref:glycosyltransferase family 25 protein n=1 Tax=Psychrobacter immobilis TaxID=498 RepID=UPI00191A0B25|nr:glycosyltransferase family 25 protein [Psychrobacter immobilis]